MVRPAGFEPAAYGFEESDISSQAFRKNWARLIQKIYHVDPVPRKNRYVLK